MTEAPCIMRLRCKRCQILIGPGCYQQEVWYDQVQKRHICESCARFYVPDDSVRLLEPDDLKTGGSVLVELLKRREKERL